MEEDRRKENFQSAIREASLRAGRDFARVRRLLDEIRAKQEDDEHMAANRVLWQMGRGKE